MPSSKRKSRAPKNAASLCTSTPSAHAGAAPISLNENAGSVLEHVVRLGRRKWRLIYVSAEEIWQGVSDPDMPEPGWYVKAVNPSPHWVSNAPLGPYATLQELQEDTYDALRETE